MHKCKYLLFIIMFFSSALGDEYLLQIKNAIEKEKEYLSTLELDNSPSLNAFLQGKVEINNNLILQRITDDLIKVSCQKTKYELVTTDDRTFDIIIKIIGFIRDKRAINYLCDHIYLKRNYMLIWSNSEQIKKSLLKRPFEITKLKILLLCNLDKNEKDTIKEILTDYYKNAIPIYALIRLGDTQAEDILIKQYQEEKDYHKLEILIEQLELSGTKRSEIELVKSLAYKDAEQKTASGFERLSIRYYIIQSLGKFNPEVALVNDEFRELEHNLKIKRYQNEKITLQYMDKLYKWIDQKYGLKIEELKKVNFLYFYSNRIPHPVDY